VFEYEKRLQKNEEKAGNFRCDGDYERDFAFFQNDWIVDYRFRHLNQAKRTIDECAYAENSCAHPHIKLASPVIIVICIVLGNN
jgi:hypothetical protein